MDSSRRSVSGAGGWPGEGLSRQAGAGSAGPAAPADGDRLGGIIPALDGWRAVAILLVLFSHATATAQAFLAGLGLPLDLRRYEFLGLLGVQVFFSLSGFLITTKLLEERRNTGAISLRTFYIRRSFRIIPAAAAYLLCIGLCSYAGLIAVSIGRLLSSLLFFSNYSTAQYSWYAGHFWSLAVEEHFYFIWPLAFALIPGHDSKIRAIIGFALGIALWRAVDFKFHLTGSSSEVFWGRTDIQVDNIAWGVLAALVVERLGLARLRRYATLPYFLAALALVVASVLLQTVGWKTAFAMLTARAIGISALLTLSVVAALQGRWRLFQSRPLVFIGQISYSLYLWQELVLVRDDRALGWLGKLQVFPLNLVLAFGLAYASKVLIEKPFIRLGRRFAHS